MADINLIPKEYKGRRQKISAIFSKTGGVILVLLILSLILYGGLFLYEGNLRKDLDRIKQEITLLDQKRDPDIEQAIVDLDKKLGVLEELFKNHFYWSKLFNKIEELTAPQIYFSKANSDFSDEEEQVRINLSVNALNYITVARQMLVFQEDPLVEKIRLSEISLDREGGVDFDLEINFSKEILLGLEK